MEGGSKIGALLGEDELLAARLASGRTEVKGGLEPLPETQAGQPMDAAPLADVTEAAELDLQNDPQNTEAEPAKATQSEEDENSEVGIQVKGGLYEGFLEKRKLAPIFWKAGNRRILRGSWFAQPRKTRDWLPLREDIAEQLEIAYRGQVWRRRSFLPNGMYAHRVNLAGPSLVRTYHSAVYVLFSRCSHLVGFEQASVVSCHMPLFPTFKRCKTSKGGYMWCS